MQHVISELAIDRQFQAHWSILRVSGSIAGSGVAVFRKALLDTVSAGASHVIADLSEVTYCDVHGFGALVAGRRRARSAGGQLRLILGSHCGARNLDAACLAQLFPLYDDVPAAAAAPPRPRQCLR